MPCVYCGVPFSIHNKRFFRTRDHVWPRSRFMNPARPDNTVLACMRCNNDKRNLTLEEWLRELIQRKDDRVERVRKVAARFTREPPRREVRS